MELKKVHEQSSLWVGGALGDTLGAGNTEILAIIIQDKILSSDLESKEALGHSGNTVDF